MKRVPKTNEPRLGWLEKQKPGWKYLEELDRKEYRKMSAEQKLRIIDGLYGFWWQIMKNNPKHRRDAIRSLEIWENEKVDTYCNIRKILQNAE
ncbi:MAG: hypothetical protein QME51_07450 [Planctomycetota bacterium]|nr:hypothetical protein [Planctomycetota bacterium]